MTHDEYRVETKINLRGEKEVNIEPVFGVYGKCFKKRKGLFLICLEKEIGEYYEFCPTYEEALALKNAILYQGKSPTVEDLKADIAALRKRRLGRF